MLLNLATPEPKPDARPDASAFLSCTIQARRASECIWSSIMMPLLALRACISATSKLARRACIKTCAASSYSNAFAVLRLFTSVRRTDRPSFGVDASSVVERGFFVQQVDPKSVKHRVLVDDCLSLLQFPRVVINLATKYFAG